MAIDLHEGRPLRWGILATGSIAHSFAADLALVPGNELAAVGSRRVEAAVDFAARHGGRPHGSYEELVADPDVDIVYVATPHGRHLEDVRLCFAAGKAVLCEKALTLTVADTMSLIDEARDRGLFFAEAMWMRTNPNVRAVLDLIGSGAIGTVHQLRAELGFVGAADRRRLWDPALGASALLDVGIYPLTLAHLVLGEPETISAAGTLSDRGIDVTAGATLVYPGGAVASLAWTQLAASDNRASIAGDRGRVEIPRRFHEPTRYVLVRGDASEERAEPVIGRGYAHEILEVESCLRAGRTESDLLPLDDTLAIMAQMAEILRQLGVTAH